MQDLSQAMVELSVVCCVTLAVTLAEDQNCQITTGLNVIKKLFLLVNVNCDKIFELHFTATSSHLYNLHRHLN